MPAIFTGSQVFGVPAGGTVVIPPTSSALLFLSLFVILSYKDTASHALTWTDPHATRASPRGGTLNAKCPTSWHTTCRAPNLPCIMYRTEYTRHHRVNRFLVTKNRRKAIFFYRYVTVFIWLEMAKPSKPKATAHHSCCDSTMFLQGSYRCAEGPSSEGPDCPTADPHRCRSRLAQIDFCRHEKERVPPSPLGRFPS